ncbi:MAG: alpha-L-fucosidase [Ignavibacteria bacterium]|jgi:alpha-L-fucosidase|nr:alpha-L-fucosidase [Ignavibacteria bacterium]
MTKIYKVLLVSISILLFATACETETVVIDNDIDSARLQQVLQERSANQQRTQWWSDAKYGVIIHWNPSSVAGIEMSWGRECYPPDLDKPAWTACPTIPQEQYDSLYKQFNPVNFNAEEWIQTFQQLGFKYVVFVTKHHDGFSMFDNPYSWYKICSDGSPVQYDITKQFADAAHKYGMKLGFYYSLSDWFHPDYYSYNHSNYINFVNNQIEYLLSNYGKIDLLWFDGGQEFQYWDGEELYRRIVALQPEIVINNRLGRYKMDYFDVEGYFGDFNTGELWEKCGSVTNVFSYSPEQQVYSSSELFSQLFRTWGNGGNFLLGIGPRADGSLDPDQMKPISEVYQWLSKYGECIYGTTAGPYYNNAWGWATYKDNVMYLIVSVGINAIEVPKFSSDVNITRVAAITDGSDVKFTDKSNSYVFSYSNVSGSYTVIKVEFDKKVSSFSYLINGGN